MLSKVVCCSGDFICGESATRILPRIRMMLSKMVGGDFGWAREIGRAHV